MDHGDFLLYSILHLWCWRDYAIHDNLNTYVIERLVDSVKAATNLFIIVFRLVRDVVANHKTTRYAGAATKVIQKNHLA